MMKKLRYINSFFTLLVLTLFSSVILLFFGEAEAASVTPHRAFYEMRLGTADQNSFVKVVNGRSAFTLGRGCNGWRSRHGDFFKSYGRTAQTNI